MKLPHGVYEAEDIVEEDRSGDEVFPAVCKMPEQAMQNADFA
jgi:hypothetical protein